MKKNKLFLKIFICLATVITMAGAYSVFNNPVSVSSEKYVGSEHYYFMKADIADINEILKDADLIVIGQAIDTGETVTSSGAYASDALKEKYREKFNKELTSSFTNTTFNVEKVMYGDKSIAESNIVIRQYGEAGSDIGETKLEKNQKMLLILKETPDGRYKISGLEAGAYDVAENDKIISHSNDTATKPYENKSINKLLKDIAEFKDTTIEDYQ
ncbi:MAG: hypothetical protein WCD89_24120 [Anaerocolumna sp.]